MTVATTSRMAYDDLKRSGKERTQRARVLSCVLAFRTSGITRREISQMTKLELGAVAGRVNKLLEDGLLIEDGTVQCDTTKKQVKVIKPVEADGPQLKLV